MSCIAGFEGAGLEFDDDIAPELEMVEKEVEVEILVTYLEMNLPTDKGKTGSQLQKELLDVVNEGLLDLGLAAGIGGAEEIEKIGVFKNLDGEVRVGRREGGGKVVLSFADPRMELLPDLDF